MWVIRYHRTTKAKRIRKWTSGGKGKGRKKRWKYVTVHVPTRTPYVVWKEES